MSDESTLVEKRDLNPYRLMSPITLAFIGDAVYELLVREYLIKKGGTQANKLHLEAIEFVKAHAQAMAVEVLKPMLTDEERDILRRGRNANSSHIPKNADSLDYRHATGLEALFGYLFLSGEQTRITEIFRTITEAKETS